MKADERSSFIFKVLIHMKKWSAYDGFDGIRSSNRKRDTKKSNFVMRKLMKKKLIDCL